MHDQTIEDRLRATLRSEADQLPFTITTEELQRRLTVRERGRAGRRIGLLAAGISVVLVGGALLLAVNPFRGQQVATTPRPTLLASAPPSGPAVVPSLSTQPTTGPRNVLGSNQQAVLVKPVGLLTSARPESIDVTLFDLVTGSNDQVASVPGSILPEDGFLDGNETAAMVSADGYLALPFTRGPDADNTHPAIAVVDLRDPTAEAWILDGYTEPHWGPTDELMVSSTADSGRVEAADVRSRQVVRAATADDVRPIGWSTVEGVRFIAMQGNTWGVVDSAGVFTAADDLPAVYQRTGRERPNGAAAHTLAMGCDTGATAGGCILGEWASPDEPPIRTWLTASAGSDLDDYVWAADGKSVFVLLSHAKDGDRQPVELVYASTPKARTSLGTVDLPSYASPAILGISSGPTPGRPSIYAIGDRRGTVWAFILADGTVRMQDGTAWFAGWANDSEAYDPD